MEEAVHECGSGLAGEDTDLDLKLKEDEKPEPPPPDKRGPGPGIDRIPPRHRERCPKPTRAPGQETMSRLSSTYQMYITGNPAGMHVMYRGVSFDGCREAPGGTLVFLDAKANYGNFFKVISTKPQWLPFFLASKTKNGGVSGLVDQAKRQAGAVGRHKIEWHWLQAEGAALMSIQLEENNMFKIVNIHTPMPGWETIK